MTAGIDLALALVDEDLGAEAALEVARWLVVFVRRPGGQSQFSAPLAAQAAEREPLREVQEWVRANPAGDCSVRGAGGARLHEPAQLLPRVRAEVGSDPRRLGRGRSRRAGSPAARGHLGEHRGRGRRVRVRHRGDAAARLPAPHRREPGRNTETASAPHLADAA